MQNEKLKKHVEKIKKKIAKTKVKKEKRLNKFRKTSAKEEGLEKELNRLNSHLQPALFRVEKTTF